MTTLFPIPETPSPRMAWMKKHDVKTHYSPQMCDGEDKWCAYTGELTGAIDLDLVETGETEADAIANLAISRKWLLWNEEK